MKPEVESVVSWLKPHAAVSFSSCFCLFHYLYDYETSLIWKFWNLLQTESLTKPETKRRRDTIEQLNAIKWLFYKDNSSQLAIKQLGHLIVKKLRQGDDTTSDGPKGLNFCLKGCLLLVKSCCNSIMK